MCQELDQLQESLNASSWIEHHVMTKNKCKTKLLSDRDLVKKALTGSPSSSTSKEAPATARALSSSKEEPSWLSSPSGQKCTNSTATSSHHAQESSMAYLIIWSAPPVPLVQLQSMIFLFSDQTSTSGSIIRERTRRSGKLTKEWSVNSWVKLATSPSQTYRLKINLNTKRCFIQERRPNEQDEQ